MAWSLGIAFVGGLLGPDVVGVVLTTLGTFVLAFALRRTPWHWAVLSLTAWASGSVVGEVLARLSNGHDFYAPSVVGAGGDGAGSLSERVRRRMGELGGVATRSGTAIDLEPYRFSRLPG